MADDVAPAAETDALRRAVEELAAQTAPGIAVPDDADDYTRGLFAAAQMFHRDLLRVLRVLPPDRTGA